MSPVIASFCIIGAFVAGLAFAVAVETQIGKQWRCVACGNKIRKAGK